MIVILLPAYFGILFAIGGIRNVTKKPEREANWERFLREVWLEVAPTHGKVTWPDRKTVLGSAVVVLVVIFLISIYIGVADIIFARLMKFFSEWLRRGLG